VSSKFRFGSHPFFSLIPLHLLIPPHPSLDCDVPAPPPKRNTSSGSADVPQLQARIVELESELSTLQSQLAQYKSDNEKYQSEIEKLKAEIEALKNEQQQVKEQLEVSKQELVAAKEEALLFAKAVTAQQQQQQTPSTAAASVENADSTTQQQQQEPNDEEVEKLKNEVEELKQQIRRQEQLLIQAASPLVSMAGPTVSGEVSALNKRKPGEVTLKMRKNRQEKLLAVRAQITAWLNKILSPDPPLVNETLMERLATGIIPCNLAIIVDDSAIPILGRVHLKATAYSILAHENVHSFLRVCYEWGLKKIECFSPEDLLSGNVRNRNERLVVETLLSLAKVVYLKFGIEPPYMIKAELSIDESNDANSKHQTSMEDAEHDKLLAAIRAYCQLHNIADIPIGSEKKGQFEFSDGTLSHIRMFEIDPDNADGAERDEETVMTAVQNGELVLLVRHNNNWEELHKFLHEHSGGKKIGMDQIQMSAISAQTADASKGSLEDASAIKVEVEEKAEVVVPEVLDVMLDTYGAANYEEEDEDDEDEEELERLRQEARAAEERARLAAQQAEMELAARKAALLAQQEAEEEFQRQKQKNKFANSYLTDADLRGDTGEFLNKVRAGMGKGDFDPEQIDPEKASFSAIINTSDYKRFKDITMSEIQVMTNDDLERLAEYTAKQEFFYLTALAVKMTHELSYSSAFQVVTNQELWRRAIEQNIPFHRFYGFITNEITKSYLEQAALDKQGGAKDGVNLRSHRELMIANIKERQKQKHGKRD
jgi:hypothetical protein